MKQAHIIFKGHIQGVFFRATAQNFARQYSILGWVKNLSNGEVELVAQAEKKEIQLFLNALQKYYSYHIHNIVITWSTASNLYPDFSIQY
jgi:acylphosphatase